MNQIVDLKDKLQSLHNELKLNFNSSSFEEIAKDLDILMMAYSLLVGGSRSGMSLKEARNDFERVFIMENLAANGWNVSKTAEVLGIDRCHLHTKLRQYKRGE